MKTKKIFVLGVVVLLLSFFIATTYAQPTASNFGTEDVAGYPNTGVTIPVQITATEGLINSIIFNIDYNKSVLALNEVERGALTATWDSPAFNDGFDWGTRISIVYDGTNYIESDSSGSIANLNFSVIGEPRQTTTMNFYDIQLSDENYNVGTAPPRNAIFTVIESAQVVTNLRNIVGEPIHGGLVSLRHPNMSIVTSATSNESGHSSFGNVNPGIYYLSLTAEHYFDSGTILELEPGEVENVEPILIRKGDLNSNGRSADAADMAMMKDAAIGKIEL